MVPATTHRFLWAAITNTSTRFLGQLCVVTAGVKGPSVRMTGGQLLAAEAVGVVTLRG